MGDRCQFLDLPKYVGSYVIGGSLKYQLTKKPSRLNRWFAKWLLGWEWEDYERR